MTTVNSTTTRLEPDPLTSSTRRENKREAVDDTADDRTARPLTYVVPDASVGYCRNGKKSQSNKNNKVYQTTGAKPNGGTRGFYSISENLGFKHDTDRGSDCGNTINDKFGNVDTRNGFSGDSLSKLENDSVQDLNKCDPDCYDKYYQRNKFDDTGLDTDDEDGDGNFGVRSRVTGSGPVTSFENIDDINTGTRNVDASTPTDYYYPQSLKPRSSSYPNSILHSQHHHQQQHHQLLHQPISSVNLILNLPEREETITQGFGVKMVATASCQQLMYRSVPPRPLSYTLTDVLEPKGPTQRSKTAPVSVNSPDDYFQRFKSRPTTRPRVIEFDGSTVSNRTKKMAMVSQGFPTARAKVYIGHTKAMSPTQQIQTARTSNSRLHLAPLEHSGRRSTSGFAPGSSRTTRTVDKTHVKGGGGSIHGNATAVTRATTKSAGSTIPDLGAKSTASFKPPSTTHETIQSAEFSMSVPRPPTPESEDHIHNPELLLTSNSDCDDLSILPRPKKVLPKRELPWVFRYKVKKGMNTLSRIMASKPTTNALQTTYTLT